IALGYKLVPYESTTEMEGSLRDKEQAINIYNRTLRNDTLGKVIVHAGYSHIAEIGDSHYSPMGNQLSKLCGKDVFTVDQQTMSEMSDTSKMHPYYRYVVANLKPVEPLVFMDGEGNAFVDPINTNGIDVQVFHPETRYRN